ncbi:MAG: sugar porter family MFS transporter [Bacteroidales bacterium]
MSQSFNIKYITIISLISALGGYLFGFDFAVISGALPFLREQFGLNEYWEGFATGSLAIGCIVGCLVAEKFSGKYGRKPALMLAASIFAISSVSMAASPTLGIFIFFRFMAGIGVGMASLLSPVYIAEISPESVRGRMVAINQLTIVTGILITNLVNYSLRNNGTEAWRWMFGLGLVPSLMFLAGVFFLPESPRWLVKAGKPEKAAKVLGSISNSEYAVNTLQSIQTSLQGTNKTGFYSIFSKPYAGLLLLGIFLAVLQQFSGINVVFNYTSNIFESIGASKDDQLLQTVFIGGVNLVVTILAMTLVDKIGRKPLMILGTAGMSVIYLFISYFLYIKSAQAAWFLLSAIGIYGLTLAPVTWILISEIYPNKIRNAATAITVISLWMAYFILTFTFPPLAKAIGMANTFYIYSAICFTGGIIIYFKVKETRGKTLEQMDSVFKH